MAKVMSVSYVDDLTGDPVDAQEIKTTDFGIDGRGYEIDLGPASREKFMSAIRPFIDAARRAGTTGRRTATATSSTRSRPDNRDQSKVIRQWARVNGWDKLGDRGRIPADVLEAYRTGTPRNDPEYVQSTVQPTVVSPDPAPAAEPQQATEGGSGGNVSEPAKSAKPAKAKVPGKTSASKPAAVDQAPTDEMIMAFCMANGRPPATKGRYANKVTPVMREFYATNGPKIAVSA